MSVGSLGMIGSVAGSPLQQTKGTENEKAAQDSASQARETQASQNAEKAAGIGETEQDEQATERDADGRRLWEQNNSSESSDDSEEQGHDDKQPTTAVSSKSRDATGQSGNQLDLTG